MAGRLETLIDALAAEAADVSAEDAPDGRHFTRNDAGFAVVGEHALELRLDPEVAEAAARTPDTRLSDRGSGWVSFAPATLDSHAEDRLRAWFLSAWRVAGRAG